MDINLIPWQSFLETLKKQNPGTLESWLRRWLFTNEGVIQADSRVMTLYEERSIADFRAASRFAGERAL